MWECVCGGRTVTWCEDLSLMFIQNRTADFGENEDSEVKFTLYFVLMGPLLKDGQRFTDNSQSTIISTCVHHAYTRCPTYKHTCTQLYRH